MIIALAGRRVDPQDAKEIRFPLQNVDLVRTRLRALFQDEHATTLVSSAACGADLIALAVAAGLGIRASVILPFERSRFRQTSVTDRPGEWGPLFDRILDDVSAAGDLLILNPPPGERDYSEANFVILDKAVELSKASNQPLMAVVVWDAVSRGDRDLTEEFRTEARIRALATKEILTL